MKPKITALTAALLCFASITSAQTIEKGSTFISGGINGGSTTSRSANNDLQQKQTNSSMLVALSFGKAIKDNVIAGIGIGYGPGKSKGSITDGSGSTVNAASYNANFFLRGYKRIAKDLYFFAQPTAGFSFAEGTSEYVPNGRIYWKSSSVGIGLAPGLSYNVFRKLYMDVSLPDVAGIYYSTSYNGSHSNSKSFNFYSSLNSQVLQNLGVGFSLIL